MGVREDEGRKPLVAFVVTEDEIAELNKIANYYGVTIAQVARGFFRLSFAKQTTDGSLPAVRAGKLAIEE